MPTKTTCKRCGMRCRVAPNPESQARLLKRAATGGLCATCCAHDFLRHAYPANLLLARTGPRGLLLPHVQEQFASIMRVGHSDATPDEIDWEKMVANWDAPFPHRMKKTASNPVTEADIEREKRKGSDDEP